MTFTRTPTGIKNYKLFFATDVVVFIEGKRNGDCAESELVPDEFFFGKLFASVLPGVRVKIKCVGNCTSVINHVSGVSGAGSGAVVGLVDRDCEGILFSRADKDDRLVMTHGYSWENDLWSELVLERVATFLVLPNASTLERTVNSFVRGMKRLALLCRLDFASRVHGVALFRKNRRSCGMHFSDVKAAGVPRSEVSRIIAQYKSSPAHTCDVSRDMVKFTRNIDSDRLIQGHLKHSLACNLISSAFQRTHKPANLGHAAILTAALSVFAQDPRQCLGSQAYRAYKRSLTRAVTLPS